MKKFLLILSGLILITFITLSAQAPDNAGQNSVKSKVEKTQTATKDGKNASVKSVSIKKAGEKTAAECDSMQKNCDQCHSGSAKAVKNGGKKISPKVAKAEKSTQVNNLKIMKAAGSEKLDKAEKVNKSQIINADDKAERK